MKILTEPQEKYKVPDRLFEAIQSELSSFGYSWKSKELVTSITELSNHFNQKINKQSLWTEKKYQAAYIAYFLPLNFLRIKSLENEFSNLLSDDVNILDFGSGPGTFQFAIDTFKNNKYNSIHCVESHTDASMIHKNLISRLNSQSKALFGKLIPQDKSAEFFGFFNMVGKFSAILGPLLVGVVSYTTGSARLSILSLLVFFILGGIFLSKVKLLKTSV